MYASHPAVQEPADDTMLWRYMDLAKFLSLLQTESLHLANLASFGDPFEGHPPKSVIRAFSEIPTDLAPEILTERREIAEQNLRFFSSSRNIVFASCWHMNDIENAGMWAQYLKAGEGIAIQTTFAHLKASLAPTAQPISGAVVQYVDYESFTPEFINVLSWGALKRRGFEHEKEFRLLTLAPAQAGFLAPVVVSELVQEVHVAPNLPLWFFEVVQQVVRRYGLEVKISRSQLFNAPDYLIPPARRPSGA